jgi:arabinose-5-phosphate isomerase
MSSSAKPVEAALSPADLVRIEAAALEQLAQRLEGPQRKAFDAVAELLVSTARAGHCAVLTGIGKSGLIARKIASTLLSTGTQARFLHPSEALHGDLGLLRKGDVLLTLSYSGESEELLRLLPVLPRLGVTLVSFTAHAASTLGAASAHVLDVSVAREACTHQLAPTASTTAMLALGDALAVDVSRRLDFQPQDFAGLHPGGQLGRRLAPVSRLMHSGAAAPVVLPTATMPEVIHEMSAKRLGMTLVVLDGKLLGVLSDGDLRRLFERDGPRAFHRTAEEVMNRLPRTIAPEPLAPDALAVMERYKITALVVTKDGSSASQVLGVLHIHDLWEVAPQAAEGTSPAEAAPFEVEDDGRL